MIEQKNDGAKCPPVSALIVLTTEIQRTRLATGYFIHGYFNDARDKIPIFDAA